MSNCACPSSSGSSDSPRVRELKNIDVDQMLLMAYRRKLSSVPVAAVRQMADRALDAWQGRQEKVTITSAAFEGGSTSGQITGDPLELVKIFEIILAEKEGVISQDTAGGDAMSAANASGNHVNFGTRRVMT